jgi:hypothetical protein
MAVYGNTLSASNRIPAWKKLGLKLKNFSEANKEVEIDINSGNERSHSHVIKHRESEAAEASHVALHTEEDKAVPGKKRAINEGTNENYQARKKRKPDSIESTPNNRHKNVEFGQIEVLSSTTEIRPSRVNESSFQGNNTNDIRGRPPITGLRSELTHNIDENQPQRQFSETSKPRRKSVTFALDAKSNDGDGSRKRYPSPSSSERAELTHPITPAELQAADIEHKKIKKDRKTLKKSKKTNNISEDADKELPEYLRYLKTYAEDRKNWKFNKSKQIDLLKNALNLRKVPPQYNNALQHYIEGLQGTAARDRLYKAAEEVLASAQKALIDREVNSESSTATGEEDAMEDPLNRKKAHDEALRRRLTTERKRRRIEREKKRDEKLQKQELHFEQLKVERAQLFMLAINRTAGRTSTPSGQPNKIMQPSNTTALQTRKQQNKDRALHESDSDISIPSAAEGSELESSDSDSELSDTDFSSSVVSDDSEDQESTNEQPTESGEEPRPISMSVNEHYQQ